MLRLYRDIFNIQRRHLSRLDVEMPALEELQIRARLEEGIPLVDRSALRLDTQRFLEILMEIKELLARRSRGKGGAQGEAIATLDMGVEEAEGLLRDRLRGDFRSLQRKADELSLNPDILNLLVHASLAPFMQRMAGKLHPRLDLDQGLSAACPVCGEPAVMGFNRDGDGMRVLECSLCSTRWGTPRMLCLFCGSTDQKKLGYLFAGEDRTRRIHICKACKKYIKITDCQGRTEEIVLPLEDLFTAYLDEVAARKGYERGCRTALS